LYRSHQKEIGNRIIPNIQSVTRLLLTKLFWIGGPETTTKEPQVALPGSWWYLATKGRERDPHKDRKGER
jgi:hypothetical protein